MDVGKSHSCSGPVIIIGAGIGGLCAALRLAHAGLDVTIVERQETVGGKMRQVVSDAGPVDAGPTVLTMRHVFDSIFEAVEEVLDEHVTLVPQEVLARHWWPDGTKLDLLADPARSASAIREAFGSEAEQEFQAFNNRSRRLFKGFDLPVMQSGAPNLATLAAHVLRRPRLIMDMAPFSSLDQALRRQFTHPGLQQLFGRYATYVGGSPYQSPALLSLIWHAEASGVWAIKGGMHALAKAIADLINARGGKIRLSSGVSRILVEDNTIGGVVLDSGDTLSARHVVFNGDPRALALGLLGAETKTVAMQTLNKPRSLSACVWSFSARPLGPQTAHHNVFFCRDARREFTDIHGGKLPSDPTLYVCAEDRGLGTPPPKEERFEIIMNAPSLATRPEQEKDYEKCRTTTFNALAERGLTFSRIPDRTSLTVPAQFETLFPGSAGSLYGQSPHGMTAPLARPTARTNIKGLYLCGGGTHPGAGVPMAATSGRHAAEAIMTDLASTSTSRRMATPGGMSTGSVPMAVARSRSSGS